MNVSTSSRLRLALVAAAACCALLTAYRDDGHAVAADDRNVPEPGPLTRGMPSETRWVMDRSRALSAAPPPLAVLDHPLTPPAQWDGRRGPLPTNSFWQNIGLGAGDERVNLLPYVVRVYGDRLAVSLPRLSTSARAVVTSTDEDLELGVGGGAKRWRIASFDDLSVTVEWLGSNGTVMTAPLVRGAPYISMRMMGAVPDIFPGSGRAVIEFETASLASGMTQATIRLNNGQTWVVYGPRGATWVRAGDRMTTTAPVTGFVRAALLPSGAGPEEFDRHAAAVPVGGEVGGSIDGATARLVFRWKREGDGLLLMTALPHHLARLEEPHDSAPWYRTIRGGMSAVVGETWTLDYPLAPIGWTAPRPIRADRREAVRSALAHDVAATVFSPAASENAYFGGKELTRAARLVVIARELAETASARNMAASLRPPVESWLDGTGPAPLAYDRTWGGVVSERGARDQHADFGAGYYNDHHFHYGYLLYASAVLADLDPAWGAAHRAGILALARDILNPSGTDSYFPIFRSMDWFEGHSWAAGLFAFGDNRNQESVSEAVSAWYGCQLAGAALHDVDLENLGRLAAAVEAASARTYYEVAPGSAIYDAPFRDFGIVGILWSTKVDAVTFFGANPEFVYGIQALPITPASEENLDPAWLAARRARMFEIARGAGPEWKGILLLAAGSVNPDEVWDEVAALPKFDGGNSLTNALYWLATRPDSSPAATMIYSDGAK